MRRPDVGKLTAAVRRRLGPARSLPEEALDAEETGAPAAEVTSARQFSAARVRSLRPPAALAVAAVLAAGVGAAEATRPSLRRPAAAPARLAPVVGSVAVCPEAVAKAPVTSRITAGTGVPGQVQVGAATLASGGAEKVVTEAGARVGQFGVNSTDPVAVVATATGEQAGGLAVEQVTRAETGPQHGLASVRCEPAVADSWYVGAATTISDRSELLLVNPYDDGAIVDVALYSRKGRIDVPGTTGVSVRARARVVKALADWAPDETWLAVHVVVRSGRVSPAVRRIRSIRSVPSGVDWIPRNTAPAETTYVGALPGGTGDRTLLIVNPGVDSLTARVQLTRQDGQFVPADLAEVEIPGEKVVVVPLTAELEGQSATLRVETDGPPAVVGAFAEYTDTTKPGADFVYAGGLPALSGPALLTDNRIGPTVDTALMFAAPEGNAEVTLTEVTAGGSPGRTSLVPVQQGTLVVVALSRAFGRGDPLAVLVTTSSNSAAVYGTRVTVEKSPRGPLVTALGMQGQPLAGVPVPAVVQDPAGWLVTAG
jgi:hypothetical protein